MPDIVERLMIECGSRWGDEEECRLERQAAIEIDRLRVLLRDIYDWCGKDCPHWARIERALGHA